LAQKDFLFGESEWSRIIFTDESNFDLALKGDIKFW